MENGEKAKIDVNTLTSAQADSIGVLIGQEIAKIMDEANKKSNEILNTYGLQTEIGYIITKKEENAKTKNE